jgi:Dolichyl-phosphate-mannose-protein mannosyltransferase
MNRPAWPVLLLLALVLAGIGLRVAAAMRPGLWGDEIFSLSMASGHSLEHPAASAQPSLGDFVEPREAQLPQVFRRYAEHDDPPAGAGRVLRAVLLSDTSPPLYYLLLNGWTRLFGTGDAALRLFSVSCGVLTLPLLWVLGREVGQARLAWAACLLFSFSHVAIYNSVEGRMYAMLWLLTAGLAWLTLRMSRRPRDVATTVAWVLAGAAGLLTHYFFAFVWLACLAWLLLLARLRERGRVSVLAGLTLLLVLPWYALVPTSLRAWRVTAGWLDGSLEWPGSLSRPFLLAASLLSDSSPLGGWRWADRFALAVFAASAIWIVSQSSIRRVFSRQRLLLWLWLAGSCLGPLAFDLALHTTASSIDRYVLPALPAAMLLAAVLASQLPRKLHVVVLGALLLAWLPASLASVKGDPRPWEPYRKIAGRLTSWAQPGDVVLVHSIPVGVVGVARYMKREIPIVSWVERLGLRQAPADLQLLLAGNRRVALVKVHYLRLPSPAEAWLRQHARLTRRDIFPKSGAEILYFEPLNGATFFAESRSYRIDAVSRSWPKPVAATARPIGRTHHR